MQIKITTQFGKDFKAIKDDSLREKFKTVLASLKIAQDPGTISHCKPMYGDSKAFRIGIGFYYLVGYATAPHEFTLMRWVKRDQILEVFGHE